jgi:hypothetical protein
LILLFRVGVQYLGTVLCGYTLIVGGGKKDCGTKLKLKFGALKILRPKKLGVTGRGGRG